MMSEHNETHEEDDLVTQRDIDKESGMFVKDSYPDSVDLPDALANERPDGTRPSSRVSKGRHLG
ncbi:hypothetical protein D3C87_531890 [compost metagenome]